MRRCGMNSYRKKERKKETVRRMSTRKERSIRGGVRVGRRHKVSLCVNNQSGNKRGWTMPLDNTWSGSQQQ